MPPAQGMSPDRDSLRFDTGNLAADEALAGHRIDVGQIGNSERRSLSGLDR